MVKQLLILPGLFLSMLLTGCVVYQPMQCAAPQISAPRQAEMTGSTYLNGRVEVAGAYSPLPHLLVRAAYSDLRDNSRDSIYYRGRQYDFGLGTYWCLGDRWLVGGLGGLGQARSEAGYFRGGFILGDPTRHEFDARYNKLFGEVYGSFRAGDVISLGAAYRVTQVNFTTLTDRATPLELSSMTRSEPMVFMRVRLGDGPFDERPVQLQAAWGSSGTFGYNERNTQTLYPPGVRELKQGRGYTTIGVTIFPHCLFRKAQSGGDGR